MYIRHLVISGNSSVGRAQPYTKGFIQGLRDYPPTKERLEQLLAETYADESSELKLKCWELQYLREQLQNRQGS